MQWLKDLLDKSKYPLLAVIALFFLGQEEKEEGATPAEGATPQPKTAGMPNTIKVAYYQAKVWLKAAVGRVSRSVGKTVAFALITVLLSAAVILTGAIVAACGGVTVGRGIIVIGAILAGGLGLFTWVRGMILVEAVRLASEAAHLATDKIAPIAKWRAEALVGSIGTVCAWLTFIALYMAVVPIWHSLLAAGIAIVVFMFFGGVLVAGWFQTKVSRKIAVAFAAITLVCVTVGLALPSVKHAVFRVVDSGSAWLDSWSENQAVVGEVETKAKANARLTDQQHLTQLYAARQALMDQAVRQCGGQFCTEQDKLAFAKLTEDIESLKDGTYWEKQAGILNEDKPAEAPAPAAAPAAADSDTANQAPPASVPRMPVEAPTAVAERTGQMHDAALRNRLCAKYPNLCQ